MVTMKTSSSVKLTQEHAAFLLHSLWEHIPDAIHGRDQESRFTLINPTAAPLFKLAFPDQALERTCGREALARRSPS